jgi:hypothetical protein
MSTDLEPVSSVIDRMMRSKNTEACKRWRKKNREKVNAYQNAQYHKRMNEYRELKRRLDEIG